MNRKSFIKSIGIVSLFPDFTFNKPVQAKDGNTKIDLGLIEEFVKAGHNDLAKVKLMLEEEPNLLYCRHDWGNGDFEEAIEGAGHVGDKEIVSYLMDKGARTNLFILTMLGREKLVKPILEAYPKLIFSKGPHGFSLLHYANKGGEESQDMVDFLTEQGLLETKFKR
ncbi:MAG: hypothetical protein RLO81_11105 [Fulvivirga sp.]|uniref:hypothetical protein n=1 Tax=Fulvivirga sp. TaxID=1931237 RepID=UPI0032F03F88